MKKRERQLKTNPGDEESSSGDLPEPRVSPHMVNPARIYEAGQNAACLDPIQLAKLEQGFRSWSESVSRAGLRSSRRRILLVFLLIRYTGAKLNEVLNLDPAEDIDCHRGVVRYGSVKKGGDGAGREVQISEELQSEVQAILEDPTHKRQIGKLLKVDAAHVRRKFYERGLECGFPQELGSPNAIRKARAVELMYGNVPLPVVQRILGHSTPNLTASMVAFSDEDIHEVARYFVEKESRRKTSARNTFFGKIRRITKGDIQAGIELVTVVGDLVTTIITNTSLQRLGLKKGSLVTAEVKAPWVIVQKGEDPPLSSADNIYRGTVVRILSGGLTTEIVVRIEDGTELCSVVTEQGRLMIDLMEKDPVWVLFSGFAVVLHVD